MIRLTAQQVTALAGQLPADALTYLRETGVPELVDFRGIAFSFDLTMGQLKGAFFRVGAEREFNQPLVIERGTGHFGLIIESGGFYFFNSSIEQFHACSRVADKLWEMEKANQIRWEDRGKHLEREIRRIDPAALQDPEAPWSILVEELVAGVV